MRLTILARGFSSHLGFDRKDKGIFPLMIGAAAMDFRIVLRTVASWLDLHELLNEETPQCIAATGGRTGAEPAVRLLAEHIIIPPLIGGGCSQPIVVHPQETRGTARITQRTVESDV